MEFKRNNIKETSIDNFGYEFTNPSDLSGCFGTFSWRRLQDVLREAGELKDGEWVKGYRITHEGIVYFLEEN